MRLPTLWNNRIKNILGLLIHKELIGLKWREFVKPVIDFVPPGTKLADLSFTLVQEHVVVHIGFLFEEWIVLGEHLFRNSMETFNMSVPHFCSPVIKDVKSLTLK
jgi:hypothetical protein